MLSRFIPVCRSLSRNLHTTKYLLNKKEYTKTDEWLLHTENYTKIGLTNNALEQLGELVFIEYLNESGDSIEIGDEVVSIESVKAVAGINIPFDCVLVENNELHLDDLEKINVNPECEENSWVIKVKKQ